MGNLCSVSNLKVGIYFCQKLTLSFGELVDLHASLKNNDLVPVEQRLKDLIQDYPRYGKKDKEQILKLVSCHLERTIQRSTQTSQAEIQEELLKPIV